MAPSRSTAERCLLTLLERDERGAYAVGERVAL
jgi:hypothetical protein